MRKKRSLAIYFSWKSVNLLLNLPVNFPTLVLLNFIKVENLLGFFFDNDHNVLTYWFIVFNTNLWTKMECRLLLLVLPEFISVAKIHWSPKEHSIFYCNFNFHILHLDRRFNSFGKQNYMKRVKSTSLFSTKR